MEFLKIVPMGEINHRINPIKNIILIFTFISYILTIIIKYLLSQIFIIKPILNFLFKNLKNLFPIRISFF